MCVKEHYSDWVMPCNYVNMVDDIVRHRMWIGVQMIDIFSCKEGQKIIPTLVITSVMKGDNTNIASFHFIVNDFVSLTILTKHKGD